MVFYSANSSYASPRRRERRSRQTQTYHTSSNQPYPNGTEETLPQDPNTQSSSARLPRGTSLSLFSRISKFEALDALTMPIKFPSLRPAHLQISWNSPSRKGTETSHTRRLSTIFSPTSENQDKTFPSDDEFTSGRDTFGSTTSRKWFQLKKMNSRRLRKSQASFKSSSAKMRGGVQDAADTTESERIGVVAAQCPQKEVLVRRTIRDIIRLYDATSKVNNTQPRPSVPTLTQDTPLLRKWTNDIKPSSDPPRSRHKLVTRQNVAPVTPTKSYQSFAASQRQLLNEPYTPSHSTLSKLSPSPSKSSISKVSPGTVIRSRACEHCHGATPEKSPVRCTPNRDAIGSNRQQVPSNGIRRKISIGEERGRTLVRTAVKEIPTRSSWDRRISDKIEELYRAKSLERTHGTLREKAPAQGDVPPRTEFRSELVKPQPRVADMRRKFEESVVPKASIQMVSSSLPVTFFSNISAFSNDRKVTSETLVPPPVPPPPPPAILFSDTKRQSNISPKTVHEAPVVNIRKSKQMPDVQENPALVTAAQKQPAKQSSKIKDRIKLFETIQATKKSDHEKWKSSYTHRIRTSMKTLWKSDENSGGVGLSSKDVKDVIDEFQDIEIVPKVGKRNTFIGRWNSVPQFTLSNGTDGTMSEKETGSRCMEGVKEMIVKEVECGLKQPKPVRATEMERMALLCRERVGGIMDKERNRVVQARKL